MKSLESYYTKAIILPSVLAAGSNVAYSVGERIVGEKFKSEWLDADAVLEMSVVMVVVNALFICILTIPLFLNDIDVIKRNFIMSLLTWALAPMTWITYILAAHYHYLTSHSFHLDGESVFVFSNTLPYAIGLFWAFFKFRQDLKQQELAG